MAALPYTLLLQAEFLRIPERGFPLSFFLFPLPQTMSVPFSQLIQEASSNPAHFTGSKTATDKKWAKNFEVIIDLCVHTYSNVNEHGRITIADWDTAMLPPFADDKLRMDALGERPNRRLHRLYAEPDMALWSHTEVSNVVLAAWNKYPAALQTSEAKAGIDASAAETVDVTYGLPAGGRQPLVIGEFKRNLIDPEEWMAGSLTSSKNLSKELRGYAYKYKCPQIFCFDGEVLLLLQFRAGNVEEIKSKHCPVDCWVIPRQSAPGSCTMREGLHRLLVQGFRRVQSLAAVPNLLVNGHAPQYREFYLGRPVFAHNGALSYEHPLDGNQGVFDREVDTNDGSVYWRLNKQPFFDQNNLLVRDIGAMW
ncbi:hypothetical protein RB597_005850 [Gaeumannomyces tritici]